MSESKTRRLRLVRLFASPPDEMVISWEPANDEAMKAFIERNIAEGWTINREPETLAGKEKSV